MEILSWVGSFFSDLFSSLFAYISTILVWFLDLGIYFIGYFVRLLLFSIQQIILAIILIANGAIALLPACNVPYIDLSSFASTFNSTGVTLASVICWVLPISFLTTIVTCMIQAVMAYLSVSWALRWLKVIK